MSNPNIEQPLIDSTREWAPGIDAVERVVGRRRRRRRAAQAVAAVSLFVALPVGLSQLAPPEESLDVATVTSTTTSEPTPSIAVTTSSTAATSVPAPVTTASAPTTTTTAPTTTTTSTTTTTTTAPTTTTTSTTTTTTTAPPVDETEIIVENQRFGFDHMVSPGFVQSPPPANGDGGEFTNAATGVTLRVFGTNQIAFQGYEVGTIDLYTHNGIEPILTGSAIRYAIDEQLLDDGRIRRYEYIDAGDRYIVIEADGPNLEAINPVFEVVLDTLLVKAVANG